MRGVDALRECRDERERAGVLRVKGAVGGRASLGGTRGLSSWWRRGRRPDVWSGGSSAWAAPPRPPPSRSRTRARPRWGWTLSPRGARTSRLGRWRCGEKKGWSRGYWGIFGKNTTTENLTSNGEISQIYSLSGLDQISTQVGGHGFKRQQNSFPLSSRAICLIVELGGLRLKKRARLYHSCHGDQIGSDGRKWALWLFTVVANRDGQWIESCCYRRELTEGVNALRCSTALIWFHMPGCEAKDKAISWCLLFLW